MEVSFFCCLSRSCSGCNLQQQLLRLLLHLSTVVVAVTYLSSNWKGVANKWMQALAAFGLPIHSDIWHRPIRNSSSSLDAVDCKLFMQR